MIKNKGKLISTVILTLVLVAVILITAGACDSSSGGHTHKLQQVVAAAPTCTAPGNIAYWTCSADDCSAGTKMFSDADGKTEITDSSSVILAAKGHTSAKVDAKAATCTDEGNIEHWKCSDCGSLFADSQSKTPTTTAAVTVEGTGHSPAAVWTNDSTNHWKTCTDGHNVQLEKDYHELKMTLSGGKREFLKHEGLSVDGMTAALGCDTCGYEKDIDVTAGMVSGYDKSVSGEQMLTVTYRGKASDPETEVTANYTVTVSETVASYLLTLDNAWFEDDTTEKELDYGAKLPDTVKFVNGKMHVGWFDRVNAMYYENGDFEMSGAVTLTAIYSEDYATAFTPSCAFENIVGGANSIMQHETVGDIKATTFALTGGIAAETGYKILNGDKSRPDSCDNKFPIYSDTSSLVMMTFINNGTEALEIKYQAEYWGVRGEIAVTVHAGETINAPLPCTKADGRAATSAAFNQIFFTKAVSADISLTVYGKIYTYTDYSAQLNSHLLTLYGATLPGGESSDYFAFEADALAGVILDGTKTLIGWADQNNTYSAPESFRMPAGDTSLYAIYKEDMSPFTPSCAFENIVGGAKTIMEHDTTGDIKATTFALTGGIAAGTGYKILNGDASRPDSCENIFPIYGDKGSFVLMTFVNNGTENLKIKYQAEYWGIRGEVEVTVPAKGEIEVALPCTKADGKAATIKAFNQIYFTEAVSSDISLTIYGRVYDPDFYEKNTPRTVTFSRATYDGSANASMKYGDTLTGVIATDGGKTPVAWVTTGGAYETTEELIAGFKMGLTDMTITALYADTIAQYMSDKTIFTPSCVYKDKSKGDAEKKQGVHNADGSTSYVIDTSVASWMIYNGTDEKNKNDGNDNNNCPVSTDMKRLYYYTFTNDGTAELTIELGPEYYGIKNPNSVTIPAGGTVSMGMFVYGFNATTTVFWQINNLSPAEGTTTLTVACRYV